MELFEIDARPRIVSLLPSATEICYALGIEDQLVGVTHECDFPPAVEAKPIVTRSDAKTHLTSSEIDSIVRSQLDDTGSIYSLDIELIERLSPDFILTQRLCAVCAVTIDQVRAQVRHLTSTAVINLEPFCLQDVFDNVLEVAALAKVPKQGQDVIKALESRREAVLRTTAHLPKRRLLFLEWVSPPFVCGHWIPELLETAGGIPVLAFPKMPAKTATWEMIEETAPELIIVSECGFGVERQKPDVAELTERFPTAEIWIVDGASYFSRPGPRLIDSMEIAAGIMHESLRSALFEKFEVDKDFTLIQTGKAS